MEFRRKIRELERICVDNKGMVKFKYFLKKGKKCYLSPFGETKSKKRKMAQNTSDF